MAVINRLSPMRIGVISDTHVRKLSELPTPILTALAKVDLIVHAGDFTETAVLEELRALAKVKAVSGNMDSSELKELLPNRELFVVNGRLIGLTHGSGAPWGIADRIRDCFQEVDIIIYGHSHESTNRPFRGSQLFNPGQARYSFGLLEIGVEMNAKIINI